jgi:segregation and condensation protein A
METSVATNLEGESPTRIFEPPKGFESKFRDMALDLPLFEGPLDLLLHIVHEQKLDILDLPMASVTKQYMNYLLLMEERNLEIAAEFISMAAHLIQIKSKMLLPLPQRDGEAEDPREELGQQLLQLETIKKAALELSKLENEWQDIVFTTGLDIQEFAKTEDEPIKATVMDLLGAYRDILKRWLPPPPVEVRTPPKTLEQRIAEILEQLQGTTWYPFVELFVKSRSREELVITFLALLELVKNGRAKLVQTEAFGEIRIQAA